MQHTPITRLYAGIGSRKTPPDMLRSMTIIATQLQDDGWILRSGHAVGADQAFEIGCNKAEIFLPWYGYNNAAHGYPYQVAKPTRAIQEIAVAHHPMWDSLSDPVKLLMCRNVNIILGCDLTAPVSMVICWTPNGALTGGTAQGMRVAQSFDIPVFNIAVESDRDRLCEFTS